MKEYKFSLNHALFDTFFPKERIKTKLQIIEILMEATRYMLVAPYSTDEEKKVVGKMILYVDKMSRLFFFKDEKYYSIVFPFFVYEKDRRLSFIYQNDIEVTSQLISSVISIIKSNSFLHSCSLDFADSISDLEKDFNKDFWVFLRELILLEDGYLRYDKDEINYKKAKEKGEEHKHPLNHYDIFYSSNGTFKIGLVNDLAESDFIDLFDSNSDCKYLNKAK